MLSDKAVRAFKPKDKPHKVSDGRGLYLLVQPKGGKLWQMAYRSGYNDMGQRKQKTLSFGSYPDVSLADAREKREIARKQIAKGIDPMAEKAEEKRQRQAAVVKTFGTWSLEWLAKERAAGHDERTLAAKERYVDYLNKTFRKMSMTSVTATDVLDFLRGFERKGKFETRDRVRSTGEKIYKYASLAVNGYNPFLPFDDQHLIKSKSTRRPALTREADVANLFKKIGAPFEAAKYGDIVGHALRFLSLTAVRPGEIAGAEWTDFDFVLGRWTIPAEKMKMDKEHIVPLSRQALAILEEVRKITGERQFVFSASKDAPISNNILCKRLRDLGFDTSTQHTAHGFRTTFSTLMNAECDGNDVKKWDSDVIELQLAHLDESTVKAVYNRTGPLSLIAARGRALQHWADRIDTMRDPDGGGRRLPDNVVPMRVA
jgi:integrase